MRSMFTPIKRNDFAPNKTPANASAFGVKQPLSKFFPSDDRIIRRDAQAFAGAIQQPLQWVRS